MSYRNIEYNFSKTFTKIRMFPVWHN